MTTRITKYTSQFKRDYNCEKRSGLYQNLDGELLSIIKLLATDNSLPLNKRDHTLRDNRRNYRECHIKSDLILIYRKPDNSSLELVRLGSHSKLNL